MATSTTRYDTYSLYERATRIYENESYDASSYYNGWDYPHAVGSKGKAPELTVGRVPLWVGLGWVGLGWVQSCVGTVVTFLLSAILRLT